MTESPIAARPKGFPIEARKLSAAESDKTIERIAAENPVNYEQIAASLQKRGPGRPAKGDPFTILTLIASSLQTVDKPVRRQILETLLALSE
jgi:hypothetical protein